MGTLDHIGGLPYLLRRLTTTIYGTDLTLGMVKRQVAGSECASASESSDFGDKETIQLGPFKVSAFPVAHSIPGSIGFIVDTPVGAVVHTGDYKLDETPAGGRTTDLEHLRQLTPMECSRCWPIAQMPISWPHAHREIGGA